MLRRFVRDSAAYGAATVLTRGIAILLVPLYARVLAPSDYGVIDLVVVASAVVGSLLTLEIVQAVARFYADPGDAADGRAYATTALLFAGAGYAVFVFVGWLAAGAVGPAVLGVAGTEEVTRLAVLSVAANGIFYVVQSQLRWSLRAREYAVTAIVYSALSVVATVLLVVIARIGVAGVFAGQIVGAVGGIVLVMTRTWDHYGGPTSRSTLFSMLRFSVPLVPSTLGVLVAIYVDRLVIAAALTLSDVGLFGIGYRIAMLSQIVVLGLQTAVTPVIYASHRDPGSPAELARIFRLFVAVILALWLILGLFANEIVLVATTSAYAGAAVVVPFLIPAIALSGAYVFMPGAAIAKQTGRIAAINIGSGVMNTVLNLALVPTIGIRGAAASTLISAGAAFLLNVRLSQRSYPVPHDWSALGAAVLVTAAIEVIGLTLGSETGGTVFLLRGGLAALGIAIATILLVKREDVRMLSQPASR
jgi:O-antigen/teichoic acid export membrane protein